MKKFSLLILSIVLLQSFGFPQSNNARIFGSAKGFEGKNLRLLIHLDPISEREQSLASAMVDSTGNFMLDFYCPETNYAFLSLEFMRSEIYIYPDQNLQIKIIHDPLSAINTKGNPFQVSPSLNIELINATSIELNKIIAQYNFIFDSFVAVNFSNPKSIHKINYLDSLSTIINKEFNGLENVYFNDYKKYRFASLESLVRGYTDAQIFQNYFNKKDVLLKNNSYMDLFNQFFDNYIFQKSKSLKYSGLKYSINYSGNVFAILDSLGKDTVLRNERIRELVLAKNLGQVYHNDDFVTFGIVNILQGLSQNSRLPECRTVATNVLYEITRLEMNETAPDFEVMLADGNYFRLANEIRNSSFCLVFFTSRCDVCTLEQDLIPDIIKKSGPGVAFLSIACDLDEAGLDAYLRLHPDYKWKFARLHEDIGVLEKYDVSSFPYFVLISSSGKIYKCPAPKPSEGLKQAISEIARK